MTHTPGPACPPATPIYDGLVAEWEAAQTAFEAEPIPEPAPEPDGE